MHQRQSGVAAAAAIACCCVLLPNLCSALRVFQQACLVRNAHPGWGGGSQFPPRGGIQTVRKNIKGYCTLQFCGFEEGKGFPTDDELYQAVADSVHGREYNQLGGALPFLRSFIVVLHVSVQQWTEVSSSL